MRTRTVASLTAGPLAYLVGVVLFKRAVRGWFQPSHLTGIGVLLALLPAAHWLSPLVLGTACAMVLACVAFWESSVLKTRGLRD